MKLLVVDDDVHIRRIVALYLRDHTVAEAATAEEALARVGAESFDVVIVDVILPHFGGLRLNAWVSIVLFVVASAAFVWIQRRGRDAEPRRPRRAAPAGPKMAVPRGRVR